MALTKRINLVFQGGGVRGIAHVGALSTKPDDIRIHRVAGTSAGAIVGAAIAVGRTIKEIETTLRDLNVPDLLDPVEHENFECIAAFAEDARQTLGKDGRHLKKIRLVRLFKKEILPLLKELWENQGLYSTDRIRRDLLDPLYGKTTFGDLEEIGAVHDLHIVAADVASREYRIYSRVNMEDQLVKISDAVAASMSIPLFFRPVVDSSRVFVDGGILSNYPAFACRESGWPTIGFRLRDFLAVEPSDNSSKAFIRNLLHTMTESHDKIRLTPHMYEEHEIDTCGISSTDFSGISKKDIDRLYLEGQKVGNAIQWDRIASSTKSNIMPDSTAGRIMGTAVKNAKHYVDSMVSDTNSIDELHEEMLFTVRIDSEYDAHYSAESTISIVGAGHLNMVAMEWDWLDEDPADVDLDTMWRIFERGQTPEDLHELVWVPYIFENDRRAAIYFYNPPIDARNSNRSIVARYKIPKEYSPTLKRGLDGEVSYKRWRRAKKHVFHFTVRIVIDAMINRSINVKPTWSKSPLVGTARGNYVVYESSPGRSEIPGSGVLDFKVALEHK